MLKRTLVMDCTVRVCRETQLLFVMGSTGKLVEAP
jgi:hypothetical protein